MALTGSIAGSRLKAVKEMDGDGGRLFNLESQRKLSLNKTGFFMATLLLQGRGRDEIVLDVIEKYSGAERSVVEEDMDALVKLLDVFASGNSVGEPSRYELATYRWDEPLEMPLTVYWEVTEACNLKCVHCYTASGRRNRNELDTEECLALIDELGAGGVCELVVGGGEPFARKDMPDLIEAMHRADIRVSLVSNGTLFKRDLVRRLRDTGLSHMSVSLDGHVPEVHDAFRGKKGAFQKAVNGIRLLKKAGFTVTVQTVITQMNKRFLSEIAALAHELDASSWYIIALHPHIRAEGYEDLMLSTQDVRAVSTQMNEIAQHYAGKMRVDSRYPMSFTLDRVFGREERQAGMLGCGPGTETAGLTADGRLLTCSFIRGDEWMSKSIREESFTSQWRASPIFDAFRKLSSSDLPACKDCSLLFRECWGGCRARAYEATGDFYAQDPFCRLRHVDVS